MQEFCEKSGKKSEKNTARVGMGLVERFVDSVVSVLMSIENHTIILQEWYYNDITMVLL